MHRANSYTYPYQPPAGSRFSSSHGTSSAFSANANANEDWTKISDLAERRRIQNRIAQRNYRKKLKRRLEDLERRAASSSASPEQSHQELSKDSDHPKQESPENNSYPDKAATTKPKPEVDWTASSKLVLTEPLSLPDDRSAMFSHQCTRQLSASPPPVFSYPSYPYPETYNFSQYPQGPAYRTMTASYPDLPFSGHYLQPLSSTHSSSAREPIFTDDDILTPFSMSYASMAGIDIPVTTSSYQESGIHTPPLTHHYSYDHSGTVSPCGSLNGYPVTPAPMSASPHLSFV